MFLKFTVFFVIVTLVFALATCGDGSSTNDGGDDTKDGGSVITVSTVEQLREAFRYNGTRTIKLAAGDYVITAKTGSPGPSETVLSIGGADKFTILPPDSGTVTIYAGAQTNQDIFQVHENAVLTLGKENAAGKIVLDGSRKESWDHGNTAYSAQGTFVALYGEGSKLIVYDGISFVNNTHNAVMVQSGGIFEMKGGLISGNRTIADGGGVSIYRGGSFIMEGGIISNNSSWQSSGRGGGISVGVYNGETGTFIMKGGVIMKNTAGGYGGGVYVGGYGAFIMEGGTIHGNQQGDGDANKAGSSGNNGAALYVESGGSAKDSDGNSFPRSTNATISR
jgi:hypothetical protein